MEIQGTDNTVVGNTINGAGGILVEGTADTNMIIGNRITGSGETITIASGATDNHVNNNLTNADISDSGTTTNAGALTISAISVPLQNYFGI